MIGARETRMTTHIGVSCFDVWGGNDQADVSLDLPGMQAWVLSSPHGQLSAGGDVHYFSSCGTGRITRMMLVDVMGHGEAATGVAQFLCDLMRRYLNHIEPYRIAADMNRGLHDNEQGMGRFATAVIMTYFAPTGELTLCNAGHPPPIVYRQSRRSWTAMEPASDDEGIVNLPLGMLDQSGYVGSETILEPDDFVVAYTDGMIEASKEGERMLGVEGLCDMLGDLGDPRDSEEPADLGHALLDEIKRRGYHIDDDLSVVVLRCTGHVAGAGMRARMGGVWRGVRNLVSGEPIAWPEVSIRNLMGAVIPSLNRNRHRQSADK